MVTAIMDVDVLSPREADFRMAKHGFEVDEIEMLIDDREYMTAVSLVYGIRLHATYRPECRDRLNPKADVYMIQLVKHAGENTITLEEFFYSPMTAATLP